MKEMWMLMMLVSGNTFPFTILNFKDKAACEVARSQIIEKMQTRRVECIYVPFESSVISQDHPADHLPDHHHD